jgi:signal transduction histidine kinase/DNA-binding response OmpR family regulator
MNVEKNVHEDMVEILIVEDSPTQAEVLKYLLEQHGYAVLAANNGKQALSFLDNHKPALVISDIVMPEMDGYELCRQIKSASSEQDIPVILLTSLTSAEDVLDGLECGADNFITKPYNEEYLIMHVEQIIANRKLFRNERVRIGLEIMFGGKRRFVTADQQQMLTLLISTYEAAVRKNTELVKTQSMYKLLNERLENMVEERTAALTNEVAERKRAESALEKERQRLHDVLEAMPMMVCLLTQDYHVAFANRAFREMFGESRGRHCYDYCFGNKEPCDFCEAYKVLKTGKPHNWQVTGPDGTSVIDAYDFPFTDADGSPMILEVDMDITDRKRVEEALQENEKRLSEAQEMAQLGNWNWDIKTGNVEWSDEVYHIFQLDPKNFTPQIDSILAFSPWPEDHERDKELIRKAMESREKGNYEQRFLRPDKSIGYYQSTFQGKYDNEGNLISIVGTILDITDRKRTEQEIVRLNNDLLQKNAELEQLVFVASHDLRSPLVNVQGFSKEMGILVNELAEITSHACLSGKPLSRLTDILTKEFPEAQNYVLASVIKMDMLLKGLLKLSRLGRAAVDLQEINMDDMISSVIKTLEFQIQQCGARMELSAIPTCIGDPVQVNQVFTNLIDNAIKFLSPDRAGIIRIFGKSLNGMCEYCVEDNGIGIAPEHQLKVFEIFHRLDPQKCEGEGLGLAIVKKIVSRLNGSVRLESEVGKGSRFIVALPGA